MIHDVMAALDDDASRGAGEAVARLVADYLGAAHAAHGPVSTPRSPAEIARRFDEPMPERGAPLDAVLARVRDEVLSDANRLAHPMAMGHQVSAPLAAAVWAEAITAALNQSLAVREMSPTLTHVERRVVRWMCDLAGYGADAGGTLGSGGTEATFTGLLAARAAALPDAWMDGVGADAGVIVCGEHAHYAVTRAAGEMGIGMRSVVLVPSRDWRMDADALEETLARLERERRRVIAVVATAGSTATGSFDDLEAIGASCGARGTWLHVDGAHGASALLSATHRHRVAGLARARTVAWDPHKMMLLPLSAGMLLARDERDLDAAFAQRAPYLFHGAAGERTLDQGVRSFQCSRRADALKLWVALSRYGASGIGALYDRLCATARALWEATAERRDVVALHEPECNILSFRWVGVGSLDDERLDAINLGARETYNASGHGWITTTMLGGRRVLRATIMNPRTSADDGRAMLEEVCEVARRVASS
jgi:L-2,4-diaminobutyrate decarboxylase